jgi:peptidoglycan hydrolase CwlO-like protein
MKRLVGLTAVLFTLVGSGCGVNETYVKQQTDPLNDRLTKIEGQLADLQKQTSAQAADIQTLKSAVAENKAAAQAADAAAARAEAAAAKAEASASKSNKAFTLHQKK